MAQDRIARVAQEVGISLEFSRSAAHIRRMAEKTTSTERREAMLLEADTYRAIAQSILDELRKDQES